MKKEMYGFYIQGTTGWVFLYPRINILKAAVIEFWLQGELNIKTVRWKDNTIEEHVKGYVV